MEVSIIIITDQPYSYEHIDSLNDLITKSGLQLSLVVQISLVSMASDHNNQEIYE